MLFVILYPYCSTHEEFYMVPFTRISLNRARRMLERRHPEGPAVSDVERHLQDHIEASRGMDAQRRAEVQAVLGPVPTTLSEMARLKRKPAAMTAANKRK
jgi:hypothetical protein